MEVNKSAHFTGHKGAVYSLEKISETEFLSASGDKMVVEWNLENPGEGKLFAQATDIIYTIKFLPAPALLFAGDASGGIHIVDTSTSKEVRLLQYHKAGIYHFESVLHDSYLLSLGGDGTMHVISMENFEIQKSFYIGEFKLRSLAVSPAGDEMALGCGDGSIIIFSLPDFGIKKKWLAHKQNFSVNAVCYSPSGDFLLSGSRDAHLNIFDCSKDYQLTESIPAHNYAIYKIAFSPDKKIVVTASRDKTVKIWDSESFRFIQRLDFEKQAGHKNSVNTLLWLNAETLLTAGDDRSIIAWKIS